jgi:integrase
MPRNRTKKETTNRRLDKNRITLRTGESQRPNGTYSYRWTSKDGHRHDIYAATLDELREKEELAKINQFDGIKSETKLITVNDLFDTWSDLKRGLKDNTLQNYKYMYNMFVRSSFGKIRVVSVKKSDVKRFYNKLADDRVLKVSTIDTIHNILHQVFNMAVDDNMIRLNPTENMLKELKKAHNFSQEKRKSLTVEEQKLFLDYLRKNPQYNHWYPVFAVMLGTGMRVGELIGLRWCDVDLDEGNINVNHTLVYYNKGDGRGCSFAINTPKTKAGERNIPMMGFVKEAFLLEKKNQEECGIACKAMVDCYTDFVFINRFGDVQHQGTLNKAIRRIVRDCNDEIFLKSKKSNPVTLPAFSCHSLRHTFTTRLCEEGVNIKVIQDILGHKDISTTLDIYADVTKDLRKREIASFENSFCNIAI